LLAVCLTANTGCVGHLRNWCKNGFKVGPDYCKPAAPVACDWIDAYDERVRQEFSDNPAWWTVFNDPVLNGLIEETSSQNLPLRVAGMRVLEARHLRQIAAGNIFPQFQEGFGQYSRAEVSENAFPTNRLAGLGFAVPSAVDNWTTGFDAGWELDVWGRFRRAIEAADANVDASTEDYDAILVTLIGETATAYLDYRTAQQRLEFAEKNVTIQEGSLEVSEVQFRNGGVTELDVTQAKTNLQQTRQLLPLFRTQQRLANNRLCVLTGIPPQDLSARLGVQPIPFTPADVVVGIPANLIRRRPDVRKVERQVAAQSALIGVAAADLFPSLSIVGAVQIQAEDFSDLFESASTASFIAPGFNWNLLNYGRLTNNVRVQEARFQQLAIAYQQSVLEANAEVENAIVAFLESQQRLIEVQGAVEAAERSVELGLTQYQDGAIDFNWVFNLQTALTSQQDQLAEVRGDVAKSLVAVYKSLGGGWQIRLGAGQGMSMPMEMIQPGEVIPNPAEEIEASAVQAARKHRTEIADRGEPVRLPLLASKE
ncbi:MAG: efflux transporter outer membrane subunit, partial [Bythopirellula sp.]